MKKIIILLAMGIILFACTTGKGQFFNAAGEQSLLKKYPECPTTSQGDFYNCVQEIEKKEGKVR